MGQNLTQQQAFDEMVKGNKVRHERYTDNEFAELDLDTGEIKTEDGCIHGSRLDEFWSVYQSKLQPADGWSVVE